jgi:DNA-binding NarL/FixJ family response regulator
MSVADQIGDRSAARCRVVLAAERADLRSALRLFIEQASPVQVVADVAALHDLLAVARRSSPDVILAHDALFEREDRALATLLRCTCPTSRLVGLLTRAHGARLPVEADAVVSMEDPPDRLVAVLSGCKRTRLPLAA